MSHHSTLRVGVIGAGSFAQACHIPGIQSHPDAEVVALCGRRRADTEDVARRFAIPRVYTDYEELCRAPDVDAITIATPNAAHAAHASCAIANGKHVLCEKPLGINVDEARRLRDSAERTSCIHMMAFTYRYCYGVQELRARTQAGVIGTPHYLRVQFDSWEGLDPAWAIGWREDARLAGGGLLFDRGAHMFDLARFLLGPLDTVTGFHHLLPGRLQPVASSTQRAPVETDDVAAAWFRFAGGERGHWFVSRVSPQFGTNLAVQVIGDRGALQAAVSRGTVDTLHYSDPHSPEWTPVGLPDAAGDNTAHALRRMMHSFVDACRSGAVKPGIDATFADGLAVQEAIDAVLQATVSPAWISLAP